MYGGLAAEDTELAAGAEAQLRRERAGEGLTTQQSGSCGD
jgi:hypothetical protein